MTVNQTAYHWDRRWRTVNFYLIGYQMVAPVNLFHIGYQMVAPVNLFHIGYQMVAPVNFSICGTKIMGPGQFRSIWPPNDVAGSILS